MATVSGRTAASGPSSISASGCASASGERADTRRAGARRGARSRPARCRGRQRATARRCRCHTPRRTSASGYGPGSNADDARSGRRAPVAARARPLAPARASSWRRRPPIFTADTIGGSCSMSPMKRGSARSTSSRVSAIGRWSRTSPAASSVLVAMPNTTRPVVGLARLGQVAQQPGGPTEPDEQHAGGVGVERARVTDAALPVDRRSLRHDVVRRATGGLVDDDEAVSHGELALQVRARRGSSRRPTGCRASTRSPPRSGALPRRCRRR